LRHANRWRSVEVIVSTVSRQVFCSAQRRIEVLADQPANPIQNHLRPCNVFLLNGMAWCS